MKLFTAAMENAFKKYPLYSQDGKKMDAKVIARFFAGSASVWYILEGEPGGDTLFGLGTNGQYPFEYGYLSRKEFEKLGWKCERDLFVKPLKYTLGECMKIYGEHMGW